SMITPPRSNSKVRIARSPLITLSFIQQDLHMALHRDIDVNRWWSMSWGPCADRHLQTEQKLFEAALVAAVGTPGFLRADPSLEVRNNSATRRIRSSIHRSAGPHFPTRGHRSGHSASTMAV